MGENENSLPFFLLYEEKVRKIMIDISFLAQIKTNGKLSVDELWAEVKQQMTRETQQDFSIDADKIAKKINELQNPEKIKLRNKIGQLIIDVDRYIVHYQTAINQQQYIIQANTLASKDTRSFVEGKNITTKNGRLGVGGNNKSLADVAVKLYTQMINVFQEFALFDPGATIVVYTKTGNRREFDFNADIISGSWKKQENQIFKSCSATGKDMITEAQKLFRDTEDIYNGITAVRQQIKNDYNNFTDLANTYVFEKRKMSTADSRRARGGAIAEAFEIHYQNNIKSFWRSIDGMGHPIIFGDKNHYGGWVAIYYMLHEASGTIPGYIRPDIEWAQVKKYSAELVKISNLKSMLNLLKDLLDADTDAKVADLIATFNTPESYSNFEGLVEDFSPEFKAIVEEELSNFHSI